MIMSIINILCAIWMFYLGFDSLKKKMYPWWYIICFALGALNAISGASCIILEFLL